MKRNSFLYIGIFLVILTLFSLWITFTTEAQSPYASRLQPSTDTSINCAENSIRYDMILHKGRLCTNIGYVDIATGSFESPLTFNSPLSRIDNTISCSTCALNTLKLDQFASTSSTELRSVISDENGSGVALFNSSTSATFISPILGTPTSITLTNGTGLPVAGLSNLGSNVGAFLITPSGANLASALTTALPVSKGGTNCITATITCFNNITGFTASGTTGTTSTNLVFSTSPILITPALGTPSAIILTSGTGLPISTGLTGAGTGILAALAINVGSAGAPVILNGALGTPSSGILTSVTGLPVSTGISGLGTGVATFLATPSGTNFGSMLTGAVPVADGGTNCTAATITCFNNITGFTASGTTGTTSSNLVFSTTPTFGTSIKTPVITVPSDSTTAFQIFKADGSTNLFTVDSTNSRIGIGTTSPAQLLTVDGIVRLRSTGATRYRSDLNMGSGGLSYTNYDDTGTVFLPFIINSSTFEVWPNGVQASRVQISAAGDVDLVASNATLTTPNGIFNTLTTAKKYATVTNCADSAGAAACSSAPAGNFVIDAASTSTVVSTTAITVNSQIFVQYDSSLGTRLGITCNTTPAIPAVTVRIAATSFTVTIPAAPVTNPACYSFHIVN